jgi:tRNA/rRNA methyltransferase
MSLRDNMMVVLVEPKNPGNIGSAVRAMKNMGIATLRLVNPVPYRDEPDQRRMGYRSQEIVDQAQDYPDLASALADATLVFLATARKGKWKKDFLSPEQAAGKIAERLASDRIALVFGREDKGVTIGECQLANFFIKIPSAVAYPSLNLAQAVMVVVYEIFKAVHCRAEATSFLRMAERKSLDRLVDNIWDLMKAMEVREPEQGLFHRSLRRAVNRTHWTNADVAVFDRFCKQTRWYMEARCGDLPENKE